VKLERKGLAGQFVTPHLLLPFFAAFGWFYISQDTRQQEFNYENKIITALESVAASAPEANFKDSVSYDFLETRNIAVNKNPGSKDISPGDFKDVILYSVRKNPNMTKQTVGIPPDIAPVVRKRKHVLQGLFIGPGEIYAYAYVPVINPDTSELTAVLRGQHAVRVPGNIFKPAQDVRDNRVDAAGAPPYFLFYSILYSVI